MISDDQNSEPPDEDMLAAEGSEGQAARLKGRVADQLRRAAFRRAAILHDLNSYATDAGSCVHLDEKDFAMTNTINAISASRRRIDAGIELLDKALAKKPIAFVAGGNTPDALLDALGRSAIATASADLAELIGAQSMDHVETDNCDPASVTIDDDEIAEATITNPS